MKTQADIPSHSRSGERPARGRSRSPERTQALIDVTLELLAEVGYEAMTIDGIVAKAHVSKSTIYRRWDNKRELVVAALEHMSATYPELNTDTGNLRTDLLELLGVYRDVITGSDARISIGLLQAAYSDPVIAKAFQEYLTGDRQEECARVVARAIERGELAPAASADLLYQPLTGQLLFHTLISGNDLTDEAVTSIVDDLLLPALRNAGGT